VIKELKKEYPDWVVEDEDEEDRLEKIKLRKMRGKGAPKKRTAAGESENRKVEAVFRLMHASQNPRNSRNGDRRDNAILH
jgi:Mitochondrial ribosomal subunit S27